MYHTFADCTKMERYIFSGWNTESLQIMDGIFNSNLALQVVDVSDFDTANVTDFDQVFDGCTSLEQIIGLDKWDTSKGQYFREFLLNTKVVAIDLSAFNMSSAIRTQNMFHVNSKLTTIYVGDNWNLNPDQLTDTGMFGSSPKLTGGNGSTISSIGSNSGIYARVDLPAVVDAEGNVIAEAVPGLLTHIKDKI
jgi:surface protein